MISAGLPSFRYDQIAGFCTGVLHMCAGRVKVGVIQYDVTGFGDVGEKDVLRGATLVRGDHMFKAGDLLYSVLEFVERGSAGIGLIAGNHARPLLRRHGACAAVC